MPGRPAPRAPGVPPRRRRRLRHALVVLVMIGLVGLLLGTGTIAVLWQFTPSVGDAGQRVDALLAGHKALPMAALPSPDPVGEAVIATENSRFSSDFGIDPISLLRTGYNMLTGNSDQGAATLEIQLAKNLYTPDQGNFVSKVEQVELAFKLDAGYTKDQVLLLYLNAAYFGHGYYGLSAAAYGFFGVAPGQLTWAQASLLGGLVQAPTAYDPYKHLALARSRQRHVLDRLVSTGALTAAQADAAYAAPLNLR
jgi:membrane peptidoglycan carboxypeptidase